MKLAIYLALGYLSAVNGQGLLESSLNDPVPFLSNQDRDSQAIAFAEQRYQQRIARDNYFINLVTSGSSPAVLYDLGAHHQLSYLSSSMLPMTKKAEYYNDYISKYTEGLTDNEKISALDWNRQEINYVNPVDNQIPVYPDCNALCSIDERYRTLDGMCNNVDYCIHGARGTSYRRLLPAEYGANGAPRPDDRNPWDMARTEFGITYTEEERVKDAGFRSALVMDWGQFIAHDSCGTPANSILDTNGKPIQIDCNALTEPHLWEECSVLTLKWTTLTANFMRSAPGIIDRNGKFYYGQREQFNMQSAFLDGSHIYGTTAEDRDKLVDMSTGLMKVRQVSAIPEEQFPPTDANQYCEGLTGNDCFISGDGRINVQLGMMMKHILWTREHNYIVGEIKKKHPDWTGPQLFEEARRIIGAYIQSITYRQYLPLIIGPQMIQRYGLDLTGGTTYDKTDDPSIFNSFTTAAFRMGHSQAYNEIKMARVDGTLFDATATLYSTFFNPDRFYKQSDGHTSMKKYMAGLILDRCEAVDTTFAKAIQLNVFQSKHPDRTPSHREKGVSLPAINIMRGRDHGLPTCGEFMDLIKEKTGDLPSGIDDPVQRAKDLYRCGLEESPMTDAAVGLTFGHMIAAQYRKIMKGDRFFYTHSESADTGTNKAFTPEQIAEIDKVSLSQMICRHTNTVPAGKNPMDMKLPADAFQTDELASNPVVDCDDDILPNAPDISALIP